MCGPKVTEEKIEMETDRRLGDREDKHTHTHTYKRPKTIKSNAGRGLGSGDERTKNQAARGVSNTSMSAAVARFKTTGRRQLSPTQR